MYCVNACLLKKLQSVQNSAIHLIRKRENNQGVSSDEYLKRFHWLPVNKRIAFKILLLMHNCLMGKAPELLSNKLNYGVSTRPNKLEGGRSKGVYGDQSFSIGGPKLWNLLPKDIWMEADT